VCRRIPADHLPAVHRGVGATGVDYTARDLRYTVEVSTTLADAAWQSGADQVELVPAASSTTATAPRR